MPSLKLSNPFRRGGDRPSLKERAASLKATASRVIHRPKPAASEPETDWDNPPEGFMAYPVGKPALFISIKEGLRLEAERLHALALREVARRGFLGDVPQYMADGWLDQLRREYMVTELAQVVAPEKVIRVEQPNVRGTIYFEDAGGTARRAPVADWIGFMAQRMSIMAREEVARLFNQGATQDQDANEALYESLRRTHRLDALHDLVHRSDAVSEAAKEYAVGHVPIAPRDGGASAPDPVVALIEQHREAYVEWLPHLDAISVLLTKTPEYARAEAAGEPARLREAKTYQAVLTASPTTLSGFMIWAAYLSSDTMDASIGGVEGDANVALKAVLAAALSLVPLSPRAPVETEA